MSAFPLPVRVSYMVTMMHVAVKRGEPCPVEYAMVIFAAAVHKSVDWLIDESRDPELLYECDED